MCCQRRQRFVGSATSPLKSCAVINGVGDRGKFLWPDLNFLTGNPFDQRPPTSLTGGGAARRKRTCRRGEGVKHRPLASREFQ